MVKILVVPVVLLLSWLGLRSLEQHSLYHPDKDVFATPRAYQWAFEDLHLTTEDGAKISGWYIPGTERFVILFCHGNAGTISNRLDKAVRLRETGAGLLMFDYRGYGESKGTPSEVGTYRDAEAAYRYLTETKGIPQDRILFEGESLGCAVALEMALRHPGAGLILESPFTSTVAMGKRIFPWLPVKWIVHYRYDNLAKIPRLKIPLLIMHSPQDGIVPFDMGQELFAAAPEPKTFFQLVGGHNDGYVEAGEGYVRTLQSFVASLKIGRENP